MKLSIITVNKDNALGLEQTFASISKQSSHDFEYIVIDGNSSDRSKDLIQSFLPNIPYIWISEPDNGIFSAMNKGLNLARGEYCLFLNSGDQLFDENVVKEFLLSGLSADIISGREYIPSLNKTIVPPKPDRLTYDYFADNVLRHQSTFIRTALLLSYGGYNEAYRIVSDWEFWLKALIKDNATYQVLPRTVACFNLGGISNQELYQQLKKEEELRVLHTILPRVYPNYLELRQLRKTKQEFDFLKNGDGGWLIRMMIRMKSRKKMRR